MSIIEIRRLDERGIPDLQWLLKTVQHADFTQDYLRKKYDHSYLGLKPLAVMAYDGSEVVGCYCVIPQQFRSDQAPSSPRIYVIFIRCHRIKGRG